LAISNHLQPHVLGLGVSSGGQGGGWAPPPPPPPPLPFLLFFGLFLLFFGLFSVAPLEEAYSAIFRHFCYISVFTLAPSWKFFCRRPWFWAKLFISLAKSSDSKQVFSTLDKST